jgi:transposase-like protein
MTATPSIDLPGWMAEQLSQASPDLLRNLIQNLRRGVDVADADAVCGAGYGQRSTERSNTRNGYRRRGWDTRAGSIDLAIPKLREGSYFPEWLLERRRRAESAMISVVATSYLLGVSTRRMEKVVEALGITRLSKSQVSEMVRDLDGQVEAFRTRPLDAGPYTFVAADALVMKVREGGRTVNVHALLATGVNADGYREILGPQLSSAEDGAGWLAFFRDLVARGLSGVSLVTSDAHRGLVEAIGATLPGASRQRRRTHYAANLMSATPKSAWGWVKALLHSVYDQPDTDASRPSSAGSSTHWSTSFPPSRSTLTAPGPTSWLSPRSRRRRGDKSGPTIPKNGSTGRSAAAPTSSAPFPTGQHRHGSSAQSWPNSTTNGPSSAAPWPRHPCQEPPHQDHKPESHG